MESNETFDEFAKRMQGDRKTAKKNLFGKTWGVKDAYDSISAQEWKDYAGKRVSEKEFRTVVREVNRALAAELANGHEIELPQKMGRVIIAKVERKPHVNKKGRLVVPYPVDWRATLKLWYEDAEARENKILLRFEKGEFYRIEYLKGKAEYNNKVFYDFRACRDLQRALASNINEGNVDAYIKSYKTVQDYGQ